MRKTPIPGFKLIHLTEKGDPLTLFHPHEGSRVLPRGRWLKAERKQVWNPGSKKGPGYTSGWHVFLNLEDALKYRGYFKKLFEIHLEEILLTGPEPKPRARGNVFLAREILFLPLPTA